MNCHQKWVNLKIADIYSPLKANVIIAGRQTDYARKKMRDKLEKKLFQETLKELARDKALAAEKEAKAREVAGFDTAGTHNDGVFDYGNSQEQCSDTGHAQDDFMYESQSDLENEDKEAILEEYWENYDKYLSQKEAERIAAEVEQARNKRIQKKEDLNNWWIGVKQEVIIHFRIWNSQEKRASEECTEFRCEEELCEISKKSSIYCLHYGNLPQPLQ